MTGRELIIYILNNNLENVDLLSNLSAFGLKTVEEVAVAFEVGTDTVKTWLKLGYYKYLEINGETYIFVRPIKGDN